MKKFLLKFRNSKWSKVFACCLIFTVFISMFAISSSAATSYDTVKFTFSFYMDSGRVTHYDSVALSHETLYQNGVTYISSVNLNNATLGSGVHSDLLYYIILVDCNFSSVTFNGVSYSGSFGTQPKTFYVSRSSSTSYSVVGSASNYSSDITYSYLFAIPAFDLESYDDYYYVGFEDGVFSSQAEDLWFPKGYEAGVRSEDAKNKWYPQGYDAGYAAGLDAGLNSSDSKALGQNLIGESLSGPMRVLNGFQLFTAPNGTVVTLGMVFGSIIALSLFLAFLKMFK